MLLLRLVTELLKRRGAKSIPTYLTHFSTTLCFETTMFGLGPLRSIIVRARFVQGGKRLDGVKLEVQERDSYIMVQPFDANGKPIDVQIGTAFLWNSPLPVVIR